MCDDKIATITEAAEAAVLPRMNEVHADPDSCAGLDCVPKH